MSKRIYSIIVGSGSYIPDRKVPNSEFLNNTFLDVNGAPYDRNNEEIIQKFEEITGIRERRYAPENMMASDMGAVAGEQAIEMAGIDRESIDYIIAAHNFGDIRPDNHKVDLVPSIGSRIKHRLGIRNPSCIAYDLPFGCPGWLQGLIQSDYYLRSGDAFRCLVIGTETLSRISDPHDRDSMIYADGAGAVILEAKESDTPTGIISHSARTDTETQAFYLAMERSYNSMSDDTLYLKMDGRKLYSYALTHVPGVVKNSLDKAGVNLDQVSKLLIHQANEKMDEAILVRLFKLYQNGDPPKELMPMTINELGNTSVATVPTLYDLIRRGSMDGHRFNPGDIIILASVGAGMNINSVVYKVEG